MKEEVKLLLYRALTSLKVWTALVGAACYLLAKYGIEVDQETRLMIAGFFVALLTAQGLNDHGKGKAQIEAARDVEMAKHANTAATAEDLTGQGGFIRFDAFCLILFVAAVLFGATMTACRWVKGETVKVASNVVECSAPSLRKTVAELKPMAKQFVVDSLDNTGKVDKTRLKSMASSLKTDVGGCLMKAAVTEVLSLGAQAPGAAQSSEVPVDKQALEATWNEVRVEVYGERVFQ